MTPAPEPQPRRRYLSMPDPCPHITRLDIIAAKVNGEPIPTCDCALTSTA